MTDIIKGILILIGIFILIELPTMLINIVPTSLLLLLIIGIIIMTMKNANLDE